MKGGRVQLSMLTSRLMSCCCVCVLYVQIWCTIKRARYAILVVCIISAAVTIPEFFEFHVIYPNGSDKPRCQLTDFGGSVGYQVGYNHANQTLFTFLPLILLFIFNALLVRTLFVASNVRRALTTASSLPVCQSHRISFNCADKQ
jgi:hypothetical protein